MHFESERNPAAVIWLNWATEGFLRLKFPCNSFLTHLSISTLPTSQQISSYIFIYKFALLTDHGHVTFNSSEMRIASWTDNVRSHDSSLFNPYLYTIKFKVHKFILNMLGSEEAQSIFDESSERAAGG